MMQIRVMRMAVQHRRMPVRMAVPLARGIAGFMAMLMVFVMAMGMVMQHFLMPMLMLMPFSQMQVESEGHQ